MAFVVVTLYSVSAFGWGSLGHKIINQSVTANYPLDTLWFTKYAQYYTAHASDADNRKSANPNEAPRHFIDIDYYPAFHSTWFPHDLDSLVAEYDSSTVYTNGVLPWAIKADYDSLVAFLKAKDTTNANRVIADLGHYIGDAYQPLHCTQYYDRNHVHSPYETTMLGDYQSQISITPDTARYISNVLDYAFSVIYQSNSKIQMIFSADDSAYGVTGSNRNSQYYQIMWARLGTMTIGQLQGASVSFASLVYSAWIDAGGNQPPTAVHEQSPTSFFISNLYPNPFNPSTNLRIDLPLSSHAVNARIEIYSIEGRLVRTERVDLNAGMNMISLNMTNLSSGTYFVVTDLIQGGVEQRKSLKALLLK